MKKALSIILGVIAASAVTAWAIPAKRGVMNIEQPDGSTLQVKLQGDEFSHCYLTTDDQVLLPNVEGTLCYATFDANGDAVASNLKASNVALRTQAEKQFLLTVDASKLRKAVLEPKAGMLRKSRMKVAQEGMGKYTSNFPTKGNIRGLVVLVQYTDVEFSTPNVANYFSRMLQERGFSSNGATGSAADYFIDASMGQFVPQFDVYGPITLANNQAYYGRNIGDDDKAPEEMVVEAIRQLDSTVDFSVYDNDKDGYLDNVYVFYAGKGEANGGGANTVWPHSWELSSANKSFKVDGVTVDHYACSNEIINYDSGGTGPDGIGTFVHEFSHVMGLPDLYYTGNASFFYTPGEYSVLDYGPYNNDSRTPPTYSAYERNAMGWIKPELISGPMDGRLENIATSNKCYIIQTDKQNEFFLLENRQQTGWDTYIPGHGMLIWHIDFNQTIFDNNVVNNTRTHQYVDIEEANNNPDGEDWSTMQGWTFPGANYVTEFTDNTHPSMKTWSGKSLGLPITDINETRGVITFLVAGGGPKIGAPVAMDATNITMSSFTANWSVVEGATDYLLTVSTNEPGEACSETADMGTRSLATLPAGWSASVKSGFTSAGNYGNASPSLQFKNDGYYLQTPVYDDDITHVKFWYKNTTGSTAISNSSIDIKGSVDGENWKTLITMKKLNNTGTTAEYDIPEGYRSLRIVFNKATSGGNLALDDVTVDYGGVVNMVLPAYNGVSTSGATSMLVNNLPDGFSYFKYNVKAVKGTDISVESNTMYVELSDTPAGVRGDLTGDGKVTPVDLGVMINMIVGVTAPSAAADLTGDGKVNSADLGVMINIIIGL